MKRYNPDINIGLTDDIVKSRFKEALVNYDTTPLTKSIKNIIFTNVCTLFNFLNIFLGITVLYTKSYKNLTFLFLILFNTLISTIQEIRSKLITDKLSLIHDNKVEVRRNGQDIYINKNDVVLDDLILLKPGNQVVTDAIIISGDCEVNESFITGESDSVHKSKGDLLLSGSYIVENRVVAKVEHVGSDNYTSIITKDAKYIKSVNSELMRTIKLIVKIISIYIVPVGILLFYNQYSLNNDINKAILGTVAALINMIPNGLILLISSVLAVSSIKLSRNKVLVQQLFCIETLARVDTLCIDKTGTITEGYMEVTDIIPLDKDISYVEKILKLLTSSLDNDNATMDALIRRYPIKEKVEVVNKVPFSSKHKYSAITLDKTYIIGAPNVLIKDKKILKQVEELSKENRVILLCESNNKIINRKLPEEIVPLAIILLKDKIRLKAKETLKYFKDQDVNVKVISGDSDVTVLEIAKKVGLNKIVSIDMSQVSDDDISKYVSNCNIFARVTPDQKKKIIEELKRQGHTVAMIGDGVNDVLALKESDCSIALASGTDAARNVSELVLLDSNFDVLPKILKEGRQSINNIERSASLFLTKTLYATLLAIIFIFINSNYPFEPVQLSLYNLVTIGIPSFILALEPNNERIKGGSFLLRVLRKAIPTSISVVFAMLSSLYIGNLFELPQSSISTISTYVLVVLGFRLLYKVSYPFNNLRLSLFIILITLFLVLTMVFRRFFNLVYLNPLLILLILCISFIGILIFNIIEKIFDYVFKEK